MPQVSVSAETASPPPLSTVSDGQPSRLPSSETTVEDVEAGQLDRTQDLLRLARPGAGTTDQNGWLPDRGTESASVLGQLIERHVVAARDVGRLVLGRRADVQDRDRHLACDKIAQRIDVEHVG
jgi:hypothetical protein